MNTPLTRRQLLRRGALGGAALAGLPAIVAACGGGGIEGSAETTAAGTTEAAGGATTAAQELSDTLTFSNWPLYIDVDEATGKRPTLEQFTAETGVEVDYIEDINANEEFFGKIQGPLSQGQSIDRDIIVLTDYSGVPGRMIELGYLEKLDKGAIPNIANLIDAQKNPDWDPNRDYSLPWQSGMTGIGYNPAKTGGDVTSIEQLLTDPKLKGKVTLLSELPDAIGLVVLANGDDVANVTPEAFDRAIAAIQEALDSGQIRQFTGNDYAPLLARGDVWACMAWSGDLVQLKADNPDLVWTLPDTGGVIWTDNMLIPKGGDAFTASTFMNFVYDPKVAAQIEAYVNYICPVAGARDELLASDPELANNTLIFPTEDMLANAYQFDTKAVDNTEYKEKFQALLGA